MSLRRRRVYKYGWDGEKVKDLQQSAPIDASVVIETEGGVLTRVRLNHDFHFDSSIRWNDFVRLVNAVDNELDEIDDRPTD